MPAEHRERAVQYTIGPDTAELGGGEARRFLAVRADTRASDGVALNYGIYNTAERKNTASGAVRIKDIRQDAYIEVDIGTHRLTPASYIWIAPAANPDEVEAVYVDRIFAAVK